MKSSNSSVEQLNASIFSGERRVNKEPTPQQEQDQLDFTHYWHVIRSFQWRIIGFAIIATLLTGLYVMTLPPRYTATASLLIESEQAKVLSIQEVYGLDSSRKEYFQTQFEILKSRKVAQRVVEKLDLVNNPLFDPSQQPRTLGWLKDLKVQFTNALREQVPWLASGNENEDSASADEPPEDKAEAKKERVIRSFSSGLTIVPIKSTQVVNISYESESPQLAAKIANTVAEVYIESYLEAKFNMTSKATTWLNESLDGLRQKLTDSEKRLSDFYEREKLVNIDGVVGLAADELQGLSEQLLSAQNALKQQRAIYEQIQVKDGNVNALARLPIILNHPSIQNVNREVIKAESKYSELSKVYGPKHPKMIAVTAEIASIKQARNAQIETLIDGIGSDYRTSYLSAQHKVTELQKEVEEAKVRYRRLSTLETQRRSLQREVDINQQLYNSFFTRLKETNELGGFETPNARVLDPAPVPANATKPQKSLIVAAVAVASVGFGIFMALIFEAFNRGIRSIDDVERTLGQRMLGLIPWQKHRRNKDLPLRHFFDNKHHLFSEAIRTLRTSILLLNIDKPNKVILVSSSVPKEGKTTVATNLAFAMGQLGKVLLIEADLRRPVLSRLFGLPGFQPGLANIISGTHSEDECIVTDEYSGVDLLMAGSLPPNPQEMLASLRFKSLIGVLSKEYDHIILDTAPTQAVSDAMVVSKVCDSLVYVVKSDSTSDSVIRTGLSRFLQLGHRIDGIVLNQVDLKKANKTGAFSGFYDQYGYQCPPEPPAGKQEPVLNPKAKVS
ncbi:GumC family protein [Neptunicella sp. SCSIO 80796]|uniref:GumC family protein n=1 Tax=Neptunicella plasticusilytica TaxID=3117012 RepID=UPI003A4DC5C2